MLMFNSLYELITYTPKSEYHGAVAIYNIHTIHTIHTIYNIQYNMTPAPSAITFWHHFRIILKVLLPIFSMINTLIDITKAIKDSMK